MKKIIDLAYNNVDDLLKTFEELSKLDISIKVLKSNGPGAGWPEIELNGPKKKIIKWLTKNDFHF